MDTITKNNNTGHTRDVSFSSYLSRSGRNNVLEPPSLNLSRKTDQEGEISVFGAERYFSMVLEDDSPRVLVDYNNNTGRGGQHQLKPSRSSSRPGTPSTSCSEASWTSQSAFLSSHRRNPSQNKKKKVNGKRIFSSFTCNGSCSDKKSIYVHEINVGRGGPPGKNFKKQSFEIDHNPVKKSQPRFKAKEHELLHQYSSFPRSLHREENLAFANIAVKEEKKAKEEEPRNSLEVFGSSRMKRGSDLLVELSLERRLSLLSWDAIPQAQTLSITSGDGPVINEDVESDASSDLFEIENLAGTGQPTLFAEQACDGMSMASTTRYEPSEVSIDWSVVTAAVSDYDEKKLVAENGRTPWNLHKDQLSHQSLGKVHDLKQR